jgi:flavin reductase (DIM6/NTAB) family NADH-FMN oxidoreductase RutF
MQKIGENAFISPMVQTILGTMHEGRPNFMALGWAMRVNYKPCMVGAAVHNGHASHAAIQATGEFSICYPTTAMVAETDYVGLVSASRTDKSGVFDVFHGELEHAPMIRECSLCFECSVRTSVEMPFNTFFIGEVKAAWSEDRYLTEGIPDVKKMAPFLLSMPDNRYWSVGEVIGKAWHEGKGLKRG